MRSSIAEINATIDQSALSATKLRIVAIVDKKVSAEYEVTPALHQPAGILNGGFSLLIAETVASIAAGLSISEDSYCVGVEINASHLEAVVSGTVTVEAIPLRIGQRLHVWEVTMTREDKKMCCIARCSLLIGNKE